MRTFLLVVSIIVALGITGCQLRKELFLIPQGSNGWFVIIYAQENWPEIASTNNCDVFQFGRDKLIITSTKLKEGDSQVEYYFLDATKRVRLLSTLIGGGGQVWGESGFSLKEQGEVNLLGECFFIGSEADFHASGKKEFEDLLVIARERLRQRN